MKGSFRFVLGQARPARAVVEQVETNQAGVNDQWKREAIYGSGHAEDQG
jgi:hypothetical protein